MSVTAFNRKRRELEKVNVDVEEVILEEEITEKPSKSKGDK